MSKSDQPKAIPIALGIAFPLIMTWGVTQLASTLPQGFRIALAALGVFLLLYAGTIIGMHIHHTRQIASHGKTIDGLKEQINELVFQLQTSEKNLEQATVAYQGRLNQQRLAFAMEMENRADALTQRPSFATHFAMPITPGVPASPQIGTNWGMLDEND